MDTTQLLLTVVLTIITLLIIIVGVQLIFVLREIRFAMKKINGIITEFEKLGMTVEHSFSEIFGFVAGLKSLFKIVDILHSRKNGKSKQT